MLETIEWTQIRLATTIGVAPVTIKKVLSGELRLGEALALRICLATGLHHREAMKGARGKLLDISGRPYTRTFFERWSDRSSKVSAGEWTTHAERFRYYIEVLLEAAGTKHGGRPFHPVLVSLENSLRKTAKEFALLDRIRLVQSLHTPNPGWRPGYLTPTELREIDETYEREMGEEAAWLIERERIQRGLIEQGERDRELAQHDVELKRLEMPSYIGEILSQQSIERIAKGQNLSALARELREIADKIDPIKPQTKRPSRKLRKKV